MASFQGDDASSATTPPDANHSSKGPIVILVVGMAGSGKTTLFHRLHYDAEESGKRCYFINLDPAVLEVPIEPHIDIRDTVDYKGVMKEYQLGPNGAIVTSLNLFATQFVDVMSILESRAADFDYVFIDTPGQIETFTWSASGQLIAESLASTFATCVCYVVDTPRTLGPATFMSNMVYACSILHKLRLPLVAVFNKTDVASADECFEWMDDFEAFHVALDAHTSNSDDGGGYVTSLHRSMSLVLDEFYRVLERVAISAATGDGLDKLYEKVDASRATYDETYGAEIEERLAQRAAEDTERKSENLARLHVDILSDAHSNAAAARARPAAAPRPKPPPSAPACKPAAQAVSNAAPPTVRRSTKTTENS